MKPMNTKAVAQKTLPVLIMVLGLFLTAAPSLWAQDAMEMIQSGNYADAVVGPFYGVDLKTRRIWIDDISFKLDRAVKVRGTSTKLGLLSDLEEGEMIKATVQPNEQRPNLPIVTIIERL